MKNAEGILRGPLKTRSEKRAEKRTKGRTKKKSREGGPRVEAKMEAETEVRQDDAYFFGGNTRSTLLIDCSPGLPGWLTPGVGTRVSQPSTHAPPVWPVGWPEEGAVASGWLLEGILMGGARGGLGDERARWR